MTHDYAVVTPLHNEAANLQRLFDSMHAQTVRPRLWLLVENGSSDSTLGRARALAEQHSYINVIIVNGISSRERGVPIVNALHEGLRALGRLPPVVGQLDADITFSSDYFEQLLCYLEENPKTGIVSGTCFERRRGEWQERYATASNVWGAARLYRRACLEQVLPFEPRTGWDAIDVAQANALGWKTAILRNVPFYHQRVESSRESSRLSAWADQGRTAHFLGYRPTYLLLRAFFHGVREPAAFGLIGGFLGEKVNRGPRCTRPEVRETIRTQQRLRNLWLRTAEARGRDATTR